MHAHRDTNVCEFKCVLARCHLRADLACYYGACRNVWCSAPPLTWHGSISQTSPNYQLGIRWCCEGNETLCLDSFYDTDTWCCHVFGRRCNVTWLSSAWCLLSVWSGTPNLCFDTTVYIIILSMWSCRNVIKQCVELPARWALCCTHRGPK